MNIEGAWKRGYTGKNIVVTILDDGIERTHPDLMQNYVSACCGQKSSILGRPLMGCSEKVGELPTNVVGVMAGSVLNSLLGKGELLQERNHKNGTTLPLPHASDGVCALQKERH